NQGDVNDAMKSKKKAVMITSDPLAFVAKQTKEKVVVFLESKGSDDELKKMTALLAKAFNRKKLCDSFDQNNLFIFDDESVRISPISKMPFKKKPHDSMNIVHICLWIIDMGCSKHITGNRALLTNFVKKFLGTVCFCNTLKLGRSRILGPGHVTS
nr:integrase, catalytic region, zinc finger, CCHC-type, peptidase aspartic, catalytic [Tanacetum cinerariifolium]